MNIRDDRDYQFLEKEYGRIARMLALLWGSDMFKEYVNNILNDTRDGTRLGFSKPVYEALSRLLLVHDRYFPQFVKPADPTAGWFTYGR